MEIDGSFSVSGSILSVKFFVERPYLTLPLHCHLLSDVGLSLVSVTPLIIEWT